MYNINRIHRLCSSIVPCLVIVNQLCTGRPLMTRMVLQAQVFDEIHELVLVIRMYNLSFLVMICE